MIIRDNAEGTIAILPRPTTARRRNRHAGAGLLCRKCTGPLTAYPTLACTRCGTAGRAKAVEIPEGWKVTHGFGSLFRGNYLSDMREEITIDLSERDDEVGRLIREQGNFVNEPLWKVKERA